METSVSPERTQELDRKRVLRGSEEAVTRAYGQMRAGSHLECWAMLQAWLNTRDHDPEDYRWLCGRVVAWNDARYVTRLTEEYVERLLALHRMGEALDAVALRIERDPGFRPKTAAATLRIARIAAHGGGMPRVARTLLADFPTRYAGDPCVPAATELSRQLA